MAGALNGGKIGPSINGIGETGAVACKQNEANHFLTLCTKINSEWIEGLRCGDTEQLPGQNLMCQRKKSLNPNLPGPKGHSVSLCTGWFSRNECHPARVRIY